LAGRLGCAGEETSLDLTGLTLRSERMSQRLVRLDISSEKGVGIAFGFLEPPVPPRLELTLDRNDLSCP